MLSKYQRDYYSLNLETSIEQVNEGNLGFLPWIFCAFRENSSRHKLRAAQVLNHVLEGLSFDDICRIDIMMRQTTSMEWSVEWNKLKVGDFIEKSMTEEEKRAVIIFSSFHPNGYIRQQALVMLPAFKSVLPFIALRLNDWVEQVRQSALFSFTIKLKHATDQEITDSYIFLEKLRRSDRCDYSKVIDIFLRETGAYENERVLELGLACNDIRARRFCVSMLAASPLFAYQVLEHHIIKEKDPFLRNKIFRVLSDADKNLFELCNTFLRDKYPGNRMTALQYVMDHDPVLALKSAESMLLDKNSNIRMLARTVLKEANYEWDFRAYYLEHLEDCTGCAILGLGEVGDKEDCACIEVFLSHDKISTIRSSLISLMRLDLETYCSMTTEQLSSKYPGIVKTAQQLIIKYRAYDFRRIYEILQTSEDENIKQRCASLLFLSPKWQRLIYILLLLNTQYQSLQDRCIQELRRWIQNCNRSYASSTEKQRMEINTLIRAQEHRIDEKMLKQLLFLIR